MLIWLQVVGIIFALSMIYITLLFYRRNEIRFTDLLVWMPIWLFFIYGVVFPRSLDFFVQTFNVKNAVELFTIAGFMFMVGIVFYLFKIIRQLQNKMARLVKAVALRDVKKR
ncbi:MAG: DUF2304 domain-containing protein [Candidatus Woesearchaeota archaeon]